MPERERTASRARNRFSAWRERRRMLHEPEKQVDFLAILEQPSYYAIGHLDTDSPDAYLVPNFARELENARSDTHKACLYAREGMVSRMISQQSLAVSNEGLNAELGYQILMTGLVRGSKNFFYLYGIYSHEDPYRMHALFKSLNFYTMAVDTSMMAEGSGALSLARVNKILDIPPKRGEQSQQKSPK